MSNTKCTKIDYFPKVSKVDGHPNGPDVQNQPAWSGAPWEFDWLGDHLSMSASPEHEVMQCNEYGPNLKRLWNQPSVSILHSCNLFASRCGISPFCTSVTRIITTVAPFLLWATGSVDKTLQKKHTNSSRPQTDEAHVSRKPQCLITVHSSWCFTTFDFVLPNVSHRLTQGKRMDLRTKRLRFWATRTKTWPPWAEKAPCAAMMWKSINSEVNTSLKKVCKLAHL